MATLLGTIQEEHIGKRFIEMGGRKVVIGSVLGKVQPIDVGKQVYDVGDGIVQVENNEQRAARQLIESASLAVVDLPMGLVERLDAWHQHRDATNAAEDAGECPVRDWHASDDDAVDLMVTMEPIVRAAFDLVSTLRTTGGLSENLPEQFSCGEADAMGKLLELVEPGAGTVFVRAHMEGDDDEGDEHHDPASDADECYQLDGAAWPHGRCDTCGWHCDNDGCTLDRSHVVNNEG